MSVIVPESSVTVVALADKVLHAAVRRAGEGAGGLARGRHAGAEAGVEVTTTATMPMNVGYES